MKAKSAALVVLLVVVLAVAAGYGGYSLGKGAGVAEAAAARENFFQARGLNGAQGSFGGGNGQNGRNFNPDNFAAGQVKSVDGDTIELSTASAVVKVTVSDKTQIQKQAPGSVADIRQGERLVIQGTRNADGTFAAQSIQIGRLAGGGNGQSDAQTSPSR